MVPDSEQVDAAETTSSVSVAAKSYLTSLADRRPHLVSLHEARDDFERRRQARQADTDRFRVAYRQQGINVVSMAVFVVA